jgi:hypothetical protein
VQLWGFQLTRFRFYSDISWSKGVVRILLRVEITMPTRIQLTLPHPLQPVPKMTIHRSRRTHIVKRRARCPMAMIRGVFCTASLLILPPSLSSWILQGITEYPLRLPVSIYFFLFPYLYAWASRLDRRWLIYRRIAFLSSQFDDVYGYPVNLPKNSGLFNIFIILRNYCMALASVHACLSRPQVRQLVSSLFSIVGSFFFLWRP